MHVTLQTKPWQRPNGAHSLALEIYLPNPPSLLIALAAEVFQPNILALQE